MKRQSKDSAFLFACQVMLIKTRMIVTMREAVCTMKDTGRRGYGFISRSGRNSLYFHSRPSAFLFTSWL